MIATLSCVVDEPLIQPGDVHHTSNRHLSHLLNTFPAGVAPSGWLKKQLVIQANGMSGWYQPLFYPLINQSKWFGGPKAQSASGQWATYWLNGNVPLVSLLRNADAISDLKHDLGAITDRYIQYIMTAQNSTTGQLGPDSCTWPFPTMNAIRSMLYAAEADPSKGKALNESIAAGMDYLLGCTVVNKTGWGQRWPSGVEGPQSVARLYQVPQLHSLKTLTNLPLRKPA